MEVCHYCHGSQFLGNAIPFRGGSVARRAIDCETLLATLKQFGGNRERVVLDKISGSRNTPGIHRCVFIRVYRAARGTKRRAPRDCARDSKLGAEAIGEKSVLFLWTQFKLPFHVGKDIERGLAEMFPALAQDTHHHKHANSEDNEEISHYSSTISMCGLPASSSSLRVSNSEYFGSAHSITT